MKRIFVFALALVLFLTVPASALDNDAYIYELSMLCEIFAAPAIGKPTYIEDGFRCSVADKGSLLCFDNDTALYIQLEMPSAEGDAFIRTAAAILYAAPYSGKSTMFSNLLFQFVTAEESQDNYSIAVDGTGIKIEKTAMMYTFVYIHPYGKD